MQSLEFTRILTEKYSAKILLATMVKTKTAIELSNELGIPIAACYRKIKLLEDAGLIVCVERRMTREGKRVGLFKSKVSNAEIVFQRNTVQAKIEMFDGTTQEVTCDIFVPSFRDGSKKPSDPMKA